MERFLSGHKLRKMRGQKSGKKVIFSLQKSYSISIACENTFHDNGSMKKNKFVFILLAVIAGAAFAYLEFFQKSPDMIAYKSFYEDASENKIASAEFSKDKIVFTYMAVLQNFRLKILILLR